MNNRHWRWKAIGTIGLILTSGISMNAQAGFFGIGGHTMNWKEEVLLHDGQIIVAERFYNLGEYPAIDSRERAALDQTVTFSLPGSNQKITWKTDYRDSEPEANSLGLILFDVVKGIPYIATYPAGCIAYNKWQRPNPPQIFFKYENNQWKRIALAEFPVELRKANVIVGSPASKLLQPFYNQKQVKEENQDVGQKYSVIQRQEIENAYGGCPVLKRIDGGWASPGGPKSPIPIRSESSNAKN